EVSLLVTSSINGPLASRRTAGTCRYSGHAGAPRPAPPLRGNSGHPPGIQWAVECAGIRRVRCDGPTPRSGFRRQGGRDLRRRSSSSDALLSGDALTSEAGGDRGATPVPSRDREGDSTTVAGP